MLTHDEAKEFYDSFGSKQDHQFYEDSAVNLLLDKGQFHRARNVLEFGCGTGKLALRLLEDILPGDCHYLGVDISETMVNLCNARLATFSDRAECTRSDGSSYLNVSDHSVDRLICTYVLDLMDEEDISTFEQNAFRMVSDGGFLCLASLTHGTTIPSRMIEKIWQLLFAIKPALVGGCRPIDVAPILPESRWNLIHSSTVVSFGIASEVVVAARR